MNHFASAALRRTLRKDMILRKILAWSVHLYTSLGLVLAAWIAVLLVRGGDPAFRLTFLLMVIATIIDTTDGWLARKAEVRKYAPGFDGRRLDDLIDFNTYTTLPLLLIWRADLIGAAYQYWLLVPLLASVYGFCQVNMKTDDHYFLGFPSYWNIVAFYLYVFHLPHETALIIIVVLALLTFVPSKYLYTTHGGKLSTSTNILGSVWVILVAWILYTWSESTHLLLYASMIFPAYYFVVSWWISIRDWKTVRSM